MKNKMIANMVYVLKTVRETQHNFFLALIISVLTCVIKTVSSDYLPSLVIKMFEYGFNEKLVWVVIILVFVFITSNILNAIVENGFDWFRFIDARFKFMPLHMRTKLNLPYEELHSEKNIKSEERAFSAISGNDEGIEGFLRSFKNVSESFFSVVFIMVVIGLRYFFVTAVTFAITVIAFLITLYTDKKDKNNNLNFIHEKNREQRFYNNLSQDIGYAKDIRMFGLKNYILRQKKKLNKLIQDKVVKSNNFRIFSSFFIAVLTGIQELFVFTFLVIQIKNKNIAVSEFTLYLSLYTSLCLSFNSFFMDISLLRKQMIEVDDFRIFASKFQYGNAFEKINLPKLEEIEFRKVFFKYENSDNYILKNINVTIRLGEVISVVGLNGAGKTTFVKLLMGLFNPTEGEILMNGRVISGSERVEYFDYYSPAFQDPAFFAFTVLENISLATKELTDKKRLELSLIDSGINEKIKSLVNKEDTFLCRSYYKDGVDFSGGEKQKLSLARALYKNAPVYILDEPSSAMDALSEKKLYESFNGLLKGYNDKNHTVLFVSHRMASSSFADKIIFLKDGMITECGTHSELMKQKKDYYSLFQVQKKYYE